MRSASAFFAVVLAALIVGTLFGASIQRNQFSKDCEKLGATRMSGDAYFCSKKEVIQL